MNDNVTKVYRKDLPEDIDRINDKAKEQTERLKIDGRIEKYEKREAHIVIKDHKANFFNKPEGRLINPSKGQLGKIAKFIMSKSIVKIKGNEG